ncbi:MAG: hypothetical protein DRH34_08275 [Deltaproteobacteria bacterium]|nr:MAG: hypothetical protein DRH34_08275 [Deltaproteobacteria bacterium]
MKGILLVTVLVGLLITAPGAWAVDGIPVKNPMKMQELIFGGTIDSKVAFYQKRIYLADSEFKILADIGKDAIKNVRFFKSNRQKIINHMIAENVKLTNSSLNAFLGSKMRSIGTTMEAYSSE